jgi:phosphocarrier protein HPr
VRKLLLRVGGEIGLHARPAAEFSEAARSFAASIRVRRLTASGEWVDGKSVISLLTLGAVAGEIIEIEIEGAEEPAVSAALTAAALPELQVVDNDLLDVGEPA